MKENDLKNRSVHMNNNVRPPRQQENKPEGRQAQGGGQAPQQNKQWRNENYRRDGQGYKSYNRENRDGGHSRDSRDNRDNNYKAANTAPAISKKIKTEETIDDIRADLLRIEKEIELEIKQIATMRLGV